MAVKVSLIVPVYNEEKCLGICMESLLGQTFGDIEIILVDDGSKDESPRLCDAYAGQDDRVKVIHKKNAGLGMARNSGLECAEGEYVGFIDSDDYVQPDMCEKMYRAAQESDADIVLAGMYQVGGNLFAADGAKKVCCFPEQEMFDGYQGRERLMLGIVGALPWEEEDSRYNFSVCKNIYRRRIIEENDLRFYSEREVISEDLLFLLKFVSHVERGIGIPGAYYYYKRNDISVTKQYRPDLFLQFKKMAEAVRNELQYLLPETDAQLYVDRLFQARARVALVSEVQHAIDIGIGYRGVRKALYDISSDEELQKVLHRYPYRQLPRKQMIFAFAMRYRLTALQYVLVCLKERR